MYRVLDVQKNNQVKNNFTGVPETEIRAGFNRSIWSPAVNMEQLPLGRSQSIMGDSLVRVLQNLRTSWITKVIVFRAHDSPAVLNGGTDEPRKSSEHNDFNRHE